MRIEEGQGTQAMIHQPVSCRTFDTPSPAMFESGHDVRAVQELLGHKKMGTNQIYTPVLGRGEIVVVSPMETAR